MSKVEMGSFEQLARPLLELIQRITGLETTFVTQIDWTAQQQEVLLALNTGAFDVPEGCVTDWSDTLCRRLFLSGKEHASDVPTEFPGNAGAEALGIKTFFTLPILNGDVTLGTVCGASQTSMDLDPDAITNVRLISEAISSQLAAHMESESLRGRAERAEALSLIDPLTGLANRRGFTSRLEDELARSARHDSLLAVLAIDLDGFKAVNDTFGHLRGDTVLVAVGAVLRGVARAEDVPARIGGDEFVFLLPQCGRDGAEAVAARISEDFCAATRDLDMPCTLSVGVSTTEVTERIELLAAADGDLYRRKHERHEAAAVTV